MVINGSIQDWKNMTSSKNTRMMARTIPKPKLLKELFITSFWPSTSISHSRGKRPEFADLFLDVTRNGA